MDPILYREKLRNMLIQAMKVSAITGTVVVSGCNLVIVGQEEQTKTTLDGGILQEPHLKETIPEKTVVMEKEPIPEKTVVMEQKPDTSTKIKYVETISCPDVQNNCRESSLTTHHQLLKASAPSPLTLAQCKQLCTTELNKFCKDNTGQLSFSIDPKDCQEVTSTKDERMIVCEYTVWACINAGRKPEGLQNQAPEFTKIPRNSLEEVGAFFAEIAFLEKAAVTAFEYLVQELKHYNAPQELIRLATQAIQEEREHVELATLLTHRYGGTLQEVCVEPFRLRSLEEIALDNAREGCVRESFGSLTAMWQAVTSKDPAVRAIMERIALEESNHGALSWAIDEWIRPQLSPQALENYKKAQQEAIAEIREEIRFEPSEALIQFAGFPTSQEAKVLFDQLVA